MASFHQGVALILLFCNLDFASSDCSRPVVPPGVRVNVRSNHGVTVAVFSCENRDKTPEPRQWTCNSDEWDYDQVLCRGDDECSLPPYLEHGNHNVSSLNISRGGRAIYSCDPGYTMQGRGFLICRREKTGEMVWKAKGPPMTCQQDVSEVATEGGCGVPYDVENARHDGGRGRQSFPVGSRIQYTCGPGFIRSGLGQSTCNPDKQWSQPQLVCIARNCGDPGRPDNGRRIGSVYTFGSQVTFQCNNGFKLSGNRITFCQANSEWSSRRPSCLPVKCPVVNSPDHGSTFGSSREYGAELKVSCDRGYMVEGPSVPRGESAQLLNCQADGTWDVWPVHCVEVDCGHIVEYFPLGTMNEQGTKWRSIVTFSCDSDTTMSGSEISECEKNGQWSYPPPACLGMCRKPDVSNGRVGQYKRKTDHYFKSYRIPNIMENGTLIKIRCHGGHDLIGSDVMPCYNATWLDMPKCIPKPCALFTAGGEGMTVAHLGPDFERDGGKVKHNTEAVISCETGYTGTGGRMELKTVCSYGSWTRSATTFKCSPDPCQKVIGSGDGVFIRQPWPDWQGNVPHNSEATLTCKHGYSSPNEQTSLEIKCQLGDWSQDPKLFTCNPNPCNKVESKSYMYIDQELVDGRVESETSVTLSCWDGYSLTEGRKNLTTRCYLGSWSLNPSLLQCHEDPCEPVRTDRLNGRYQPSSGWETSGKVKPGTQVTLSCKDGYISQDERKQLQTKCKRGRWTDDPFSFSCKEKPCKVLSHRNNTRIIYEDDNLITTENPSTDLPPSSTLSVTCDLGYRLADDVEIGTMCIQGEWGPPIPEKPCIQTSCERIPSDIYTYLTYNEHQSQWQTTDGRVLDGSTVKAQCIDGYVQDFTEPIKCLNGKWSEEPETILCHPKGCTTITHANLTSFDGQATEGQFPHGSVYNVRCQEGFDLEPAGMSIIRCRLGNWDTNITCKSKSCKVPLNSSYTASRHGHRLRQNSMRPHGDIVIINCTETTFQYNSTCLKGKWSPEVPSCSAEKCTLKSLTNGFWVDTNTEKRVNESSVWPQTEVKPVCDVGYQAISGDSMTDYTLICKTDGSWTKTAGPVLCEPETCQLPPSIENGNYMSPNVQLTISKNDPATWYKCDWGYTPDSGEGSSRSARVSCDHGQLKPAKPACLREFDCDLPPINGEYKSGISSLKHGANTTYKCASSQEWTPIECYNGTLRPDLPACESAGCSNAESCFDMTRGCFPISRTSSHDATFRNIELNGCREKCISHSEFTCTMATYRKSGKSCIIYDGSVSVLRCRSNSTLTWLMHYIFLQRRLIPDDCLLPKIDGTYNGQQATGPIDLRHGTTVVYQCNSGAPAGQKTIRCDNGRLLPSEPYCERPVARACSLPEVQNGYYPNGPADMMLSSGSHLSYECNEGYTPQHPPATVNCQEGQISSEPACVNTDCHSDGSCIEAFKHCRHEDITTHASTDYFPQITLQECKDRCFSSQGFICKTAHYNEYSRGCMISSTMVQSNKVRCVGNSTSPTPEGTTLLERSWPQRCTGPNSFPNGTWQIKHGYSGTRDRIYFCCNEDFTLKGSPVLECRGPWKNDSIPHCVPEENSHRLDIYSGGRNDASRKKSFSRGRNLVVDCYRYYGHRDVEWFYWSGHLDEGTHESTGNQLRFKTQTSFPIRGNITYMCTNWHYQFSKCVTFEFTTG